MGRRVFWSAIGMAWIASGGCSAASAPSPAGPTTTAAQPSATSVLIPDELIPEGDWLEGDTSRAEELIERYPRDPRARYLMARRALGSGDRAAAEEHLGAALRDRSLLDSSSEINWRIRTLLAVVLAEDGRAEDALEVAGLMCAQPDADLTPPFMEPLIARLAEARVCSGGGMCARAYRCCEAYVRAMSTVAPSLPEQRICENVRSVENTPDAERSCAAVLDAFREAIEVMPNLTSPPECARERGAVDATRVLPRR